MAGISEDYFTNTVAGAAAYEDYRSGGADYGPEPEYTRADAMADAAADRETDYAFISEDGLFISEDGLFEIDAKGKCTLCRGSGDIDNCPRRCDTNGHQDCDPYTCPQCEGEGGRDPDEEDKE